MAKKLKAVPDPEPTPVQEDDPWIPLSAAREFVLKHLPEEPDENGDCETCRVIKAIADGFVPVATEHPEDA